MKWKHKTTVSTFTVADNLDMSAEIARVSVEVGPQMQTPGKN